MSLHRKRKRSIIDELFGTSMLEEFPEEALEGGYSISVVQTPEGTKVKAKVGKDVDLNALKRQLQREYPNAQIEIEGGKTEPLIREISTKTLKKKSDEEEHGK
jgi:hypothetical protein